MYQNDVSLMTANLERANAFLVERKAIIERSVVRLADGSEWLIEATIHKFVHVPGDSLGLRLLVPGQLHVTGRRYEVVAIECANEFANHAAGIAPAERVRRRRRSLRRRRRRAGL